MSALGRLAAYRRGGAVPLRWRLTLVCVAGYAMAASHGPVRGALPAGVPLGL